MMQDKELLAAFYAAVGNNIGIYAASVTGGDKPYEKRTEWMEGWNAGVMAHKRMLANIIRWWSKLDDTARNAIGPLVKQDQLNINANEDDETILLNVNCNDLFFWGCADAEDITIEQLPELSECIKQAGKVGDLLWCAKQRGMRPQGAFYKHFPKETWPLFDACGAKRETGMGNPKEPGA